MSKRAARIPPSKTSRRGRSISARVDRQKPARKTIALKKATQSRLKRRRSNAARPHQELKVSTPPSTTTPDSKSATDTPDQPAVTRRMTRSHAAILATIAVLVVAALALPRRSAVLTSPAADSKADTPGSAVQPAAPVAAAPAPEVEPTPVSVAQPEVAPVVAESVKKPPVRPAQKSTARATRPSIAGPVVETRNKETSLTDIGPAATVEVPVAPPSDAAIADRVTITGCLENADGGNRFRLTDTEGASAPKSRSWRTGFLKKRSAAVDLVGAPDLAALRQQVGQRIAVTGVQTDRELKVSSVRVISTSCK